MRTALALISAVAATLAGCTFDCPACVDAGGCQSLNAWGAQVTPSPGTDCSSLDSGLDDAGGRAVGTCAEDAGAHSWGLDIHSANTLHSGQGICARLVIPEPPASATRMDLLLHCTACTDGGVCSCADEPATCQSGSWTQGLALPSAITAGPFAPISPLCQVIDASLSVASPSSGTLTFDQAWLWVTAADAGCNWNDAQECPGP